MNKFKENTDNKKQKIKPKNKLAGSLAGLFTGSLLTRQGVVKHLPYLLFLALLALMYIANGYMAEGTVRELNQVNGELKELRSEYITTKSDLMYYSKQSQIAAITGEKQLGLAESYTPPKKIVVKTTQLQKD